MSCCACNCHGPQAIVEKTEGKRTVKIFVDEEPLNPRTDWEPLGTILYTSSRYTLGDKRVSSEEIEEIIADVNNVYLPVYAYIHGGIALSTGGFNDPWDSGQCGIIYISKEKIAKEYGDATPATVEKVLGYLKGEVETFSKYLKGEVYGYVIEEEGEEPESCWGFFEDPSKLAKDALAGNV